MQDPMIEKLVRFTHLEKLYGFLHGMSEATMAALLGLDGAEHREIKARFDANAREAARDLLEDPLLAGRVDRLPFRADDAVASAGDSFTDDLQPFATRGALSTRGPSLEKLVVRMAGRPRDPRSGARIGARVSAAVGAEGIDAA